MPSGFKIHLPFARWPGEDQARWQAAFKSGDRFDESGRGSRLAEATRRNRRESYARFLGFIAACRQDLLNLPPEARVDRLVVTDYVAWRRKSCGASMVAVDLEGLRGALRLICPDVDWSWLLKIAKRIAATATRIHQKYHMVTSERLYALGVELMDHAAEAADAHERMSLTHALEFRDGLVIAFLALIPLRSRTLTALRVGRQLVKTGDLWALDIPATDTKSGRPLDYPIAIELSWRIDLYLERFRCVIHGAGRHTSPWASIQGRPMCATAIYYRVCGQTKKAFGFPVTLHRFRHAAASLWSIHDPRNVRGVKDLLGHASFGTTEKHYVAAQSRLAGRAFADSVDALRK